MELYMVRLILILIALVVVYFFGQLSVLYNITKMSDETFFRFFIRMYIFKKKHEEKNNEAGE